MLSDMNAVIFRRAGILATASSLWLPTHILLVRSHRQNPFSPDNMQPTVRLCMTHGTLLDRHIFNLLDNGAALEAEKR
jgi:hypothetical protein